VSLSPSLKEKIGENISVKQILVHFYVVNRTFCKGSAKNATLKIEFSLPLLPDGRIQTS